MKTIELAFEVAGPAREILLAHLIDAGCEAFQETDAALLAFVPEERYDAAMKASIEEHGLHFSARSINPQNWNAAWESSFDPVTVPGFCLVRAAFHSPAGNIPHEIIVTPKMSFGTGHHATTRLMISAMKDVDFTGKNVLDFGTGTGILGILASKLGAGKVFAIDNDIWSVENAGENVAANNVQNVHIAQGSLEVASDHAPFEIILANINRHILLQYMESLKSMMTPAGVLLLSGILFSDAGILRQTAEGNGFQYVATLDEGDWIAMKFTSESSTFPGN